MYIDMYVYMYLSMYVCMYVCVCSVFIYIWDETVTILMKWSQWSRRELLVNESVYLDVG